MLVFRGTSPKCGLSRRVPSGPGAEGTQRAGKGGAVRAARGSCSPRAANQRLRRLRGAGPRGSGKMAAVGGGGIGPGGGPGARRGSTGRDAEAEVWCRRVRELVSAVPANRLCFECGQRGVTYVDISVGSLVCTGCSGALRGLNPPHRVKSISMTTFTEAEVLFLQAHGNEACRRIWLGTFNPRTSLLPDSCDPQKVKEFLQEKYEKKRWYVAPEQVKPPQSTTVEPRPLQALHGDTGTLPQPRPAAHHPPQPARKAGTDLLAAIGGDTFASPAPAPAFAVFPGLPFSGFNVAKASTNPFVVRRALGQSKGDGGFLNPLSLLLIPPLCHPQTVPTPTAPFSTGHPTTNPFL
ncbi:arf-GAP domain and FG repeat-containing protein 2 isoform X15 [Cinclus cinclus]|uniref:arf-GAP domain and FG repeat-containing protein 2 isoform X15 n=1 Tax=Cinclus cinclus TaxID=127875 RepID=UPI002E150C87